MPVPDMQHSAYPRYGWHSGHLRVLEALYSAGRPSRTELARATGLSVQSLTRITAELIASGHVAEASRRIGQRGQPAIELALRPSRLVSLGLVLEHDRITCVSKDLADATMTRWEESGDFLSAEATARAAERLVEQALATLPAGAERLGLGIAQSGFFFLAGEQRIVSRNDVAGWAGLDLAGRLGERFGLDVIIENDGSAAAVGHTIHGIGTTYHSFFLVLLTRGVGGGVISERRLLRGRLGNAGELAVLMPVDPGEIRPTTESLRRWLADAWGHEPDSAAIEAALDAGDPTLRRWLDQAAETLGKALNGVTALLDPEAIILAGRLSPRLRGALAARLQMVSPRIDGIVAPSPAILVDPESDCLEFGAAALPIARFFSPEAPRQAG